MPTASEASSGRVQSAYRVSTRGRATLRRTRTASAAPRGGRPGSAARRAPAPSAPLRSSPRARCPGRWAPGCSSPPGRSVELRRPSPASPRRPRPARTPVRPARGPIVWPTVTRLVDAQGPALLRRSELRLRQGLGRPARPGPRRRGERAVLPRRSGDPAAPHPACPGQGAGRARSPERHRPQAHRPKRIMSSTCRDASVAGVPELDTPRGTASQCAHVTGRCRGTAVSFR
jgi:hypothetical protein